MKRYAQSAGIIFFILILDIITKQLVVNYLGYSSRLDYLGGFIRIALVYNKGGVFGIMQGYKNLFLVVSIIVLIMMLVYYYFEKNKTTLFTLSMSFIVAGALGNIIDRVIPGRPGVVDFISVGVDGVYRWPSFNVADSSIVVGAFILVIVFYLEEKRRKDEQSSYS